MKKIVIIMCILLYMYLISYNEYNNTEDSIRFRVISNSNSSRDIIMKEKVVNESSSIVFIDSNDEEEIKNNIYNNLEKIDDKIAKLFENNNYNQKYNISYGLNEFPKKSFMGKKYEAGLYESLVVEIGEAKGDNYFCILYPSLCMIDYKNKSEKYSLKIVELLHDLF